jgi:hypothetical protein
MKKITSFLFAVLLTICVFSQEKKVAVYPVGFYNLENLYHPESTDEFRDKEFSPSGSYAWTMEKYGKKLSNMSFTLNEIAKDFGGLVCVGVAEVGNRQVLEDLVATEPLADKHWAVVHYQSPDWRGVDVALLYNPTKFELTSSSVHPFPYEEGIRRGVTDETFRTRDVLLVNGKIAGENVAVIVSHWPSRRGDKSVVSRELGASVVKYLYDSLYNADPTIKVIIMGDLNDDPVDLSCRVVLGAKQFQNEVEAGGLFNPMWEKYSKGIGSLCYRGKWNLFDQIIVSKSLLNSDNSSLSFYKAEVFNKDFLINKAGKYKGYPLRTFNGGIFQNGYSDHFPTFIYLVKESE